jgi:hypothetical protein
MYTEHVYLILTGDNDISSSAIRTGVLYLEDPSEPVSTH